VTCQQEAALEAEGVTREREARERGMSGAHDESSMVGEIRVANEDGARWGRIAASGWMASGGEWEAHEGEGLRLE
jgi:hypothetical protein